MAIYSPCWISIWCALLNDILSPLRWKWIQHVTFRSWISLPPNLGIPETWYNERRVSLKEAEVNREYHSLRKYLLIVFVVFAREHKQLFELFVGFGCWFQSWSSTLFRTCYIIMTLFSYKINFNFDLSIGLNLLANEYMLVPIYTYFCTLV